MQYRPFKNILRFSLAILGLSTVGSMLAQNAVTNGDFASNALSFTTNNGYVEGSNPADIQNWTKSTNGLGINGVGLSNPFGPADKSAATYYAFLQNGGKNISQDITAGLSASSSYEIFFAAGNRGSNPNAQGSVVVQDNSTVYYDSGITVWGNAAFQTVKSSFVTPAIIDGAVTISLRNDSGAGDNTVCYSNVAILPPADPSLTFMPISGDVDSGISSAKTYTHAIDFGSGAPTTVNGVLFQNVFNTIAGSPATVGSGSTNISTTHGGNPNAAAYLIDGGMEGLVQDMVYGAATGSITLTGLTPEVEYQVKLYNRQWGAGDRGQDIGFETDGVGSDITSAEVISTFEEDNASSPFPGFPTATQVYAFVHTYTLPAGVDSLTIYINQKNTGSYHLYGLTNEVAVGPMPLVLNPADDSTNVSPSSDFGMTFDKHIVKGTGNFTIRESITGMPVEVIDVTSAKVTIDAYKLTINPDTVLSSKTGYYVEMDSGAIEDLTGHAIAGISGGSTWNFITSEINFIPISGDADSGISDTKTYTHAIDFGNDATAALVNGVQFQIGKPGFDFEDDASATVGTGTINLPGSHPGNGGANAYLVDGAMEDLVRDMAFNANNGIITLTGLSSGQKYKVRLYNRQWGAGDRGQEIGFDTDGVGSDITEAEARAIFEEDNATTFDPAFETATQVYALTYDYTLPTGVTELKIYINRRNTGSYHFYGLTNELDAPPLVTATLPVDDSATFGIAQDLVMQFDEAVSRGSGNIVIKRSSDDSIVETISINSAQISIDRQSVVIDPSNDLDLVTGYYVEVDSGALTDFGGNAFPGISGSSTWNFTTSAIYFAAINGDADSGIDSAKVYTHAIDFGNNVAARPVAVINGVTFAGGGIGAFPAIGSSSQTVGSGSSTLPTSHSGDDGAAPFLIDGGVEALVGDMLYNNANAQILLTGLTSGQVYRFKLYHRSWDPGHSRHQVVSIDTDGVAGAEAGVSLNEDDASELSPNFASVTQVNALTYEYTLAPGVTILTVNIDQTGTGSYHLYGLTNEEVSIYDTWVNANGLTGGDAADTADVESGGAGDGLVNLLEFAFGTNPNANDNSPLVVIDGSTFTPGTQIVKIQSPFNPSNITAQFARRKDAAAAGLTYVPEFSADMTTWEAHASAPTPDVVSTNAGDYEIVEVPYLVFLSNGQKASFCRIRVNSTGSGPINP